MRAARKTALELLLSDHAGDCIGPCRTGCPARLDIPNFIARIAAGDHARRRRDGHGRSHVAGVPGARLPAAVRAALPAV